MSVNPGEGQFGVGLFATGYAVVARMHLSSASTLVDEASPEAIMDRYVKRSVELVSNVEMASEQLAAFASSTIQKTAEVTDTARSTVEKTMLDAARAFEHEIRSTLESARESLTSMRGLVTDVSFASEREELANSMKATVAAVTALNQALGELASTSREGAQASQQSLLTSAALDQTLQQFSAHIRQLGGEEGVLIQSTQLLQEASHSIAACNTSMASAATGLTEMAKVVSDAGPMFKNMQSFTTEAGKQLDHLADAAGKLDAAATGIAGAAAASDSLVTGLERMSATLSPLQASAELLTARLANAGSVSEKLGQQLAVLPQSMEAATRLLTTTDDVHQSVSSLLSQFRQLAESVLATQRVLSDSSDSIKTSIARSTETLEADVSRSTKAASLLTEKLIQVAQNIIDRTKHPESVR